MAHYNSHIMSIFLYNPLNCDPQPLKYRGKNLKGSCTVHLLILSHRIWNSSQFRLAMPWVCEQRWSQGRGNGPHHVS